MHIPRPNDFVFMSVPYVWKKEIYSALIIIQIDQIFYDHPEWVIESRGHEYYAADCIICESILVEETLGTIEDCEFNR